MLNSDQLIARYLVIRYPIAKECTCRIEINTIKALRFGREKKIREQLKGLPETDKRDVINKMIEKESNNVGP